MEREAFAAALRLVLEDAALQEWLLVAGFRRAAHFSWDETARGRSKFISRFIRSTSLLVG